jgi:hypothetical protein
MGNIRVRPTQLTLLEGKYKGQAYAIDITCIDLEKSQMRRSDPKFSCLYRFGEKSNA